MTIDPINLKSAASMIAQSLTSVHTQSSPAVQKTASAAANGSTVSSTDFLTLLVTEMKNQDPTQPTDPSAYIQQMVGVNSLQQLIAINQELTPPVSSTPQTPVTANAAMSVNSL
jgi:flagellar basal-body rod modification protein FlgD